MGNYYLIIMIVVVMHILLLTMMLLTNVPMPLRLGKPLMGSGSLGAEKPGILRSLGSGSLGALGAQEP